MLELQRPPFEQGKICALEPLINACRKRRLVSMCSFSLVTHKPCVYSDSLFLGAISGDTRYVFATCFEELQWLCTWTLSVPDVCITKDRVTDNYACFFCYKEAHALVTAVQAKSCHLAFRICILIAQLAGYEGVHTCLCLARLSYTPLLLRVSSNHRLIKS